MFKWKQKAAQPKALLPKFDVAIGLWRKAEIDVHVALARFRAAPNPVTRLGISMAWAALQVPLGTLSSWAKEHRMASNAATWAYRRAKGLQVEIQQGGFVEERPIILD